MTSSSSLSSSSSSYLFSSSGSAAVAAVAFKQAIDRASEELEPIGYCVTAEQNWRDDHDRGWDEEEEEEVQEEEEEQEGRNEQDKDDEAGDESSSSASVSARNVSVNASKDKKRVKVFNSFPCAPIDSKIANADLCGSITITHPRYQGVLNLDKTDKETGCMIIGEDKTGSYLQKWFECADPSPYGDMQSMTTVLDTKVRDAREFKAEFVTVSDDLIEQLKQLWQSSFWPRKVRIAPYKLNVYGPGGKFKAHKDTAETNLVGTILVGLGDTSDGEFHVGNQIWYEASADSWCAFYPSTTHEVIVLRKGYRATLAFKVYRTEVTDAVEETKEVSEMTEYLTRLGCPFGLLLRHEYSFGTTAWNGSDALLYAAAKKIPDVTVHTIPVMTHFEASCYVGDDDKPNNRKLSSAVYPLRDSDLQYLMKQRTDREPCVSWKSIPFYAFAKLNQSGFTWSQHCQEGAEYTGNECIPESQDSVYVHYAIIVVPETSDAVVSQGTKAGNKKTSGGTKIGRQ